MGRGRAKAKQIKVARKLKYSTPETDLTALERELRASRGEPSEGYSPVEDDAGEDNDTHASYDADDDQDDYGSWTGNGHR
ncbi:DUF3073 domain-containing protein [Ornithinimicrobium pratense]|uniref:DUF3073 domain-containing protein n=1 Tax=Ornithinimicrobium pratense TaxID=2593973 RepID=A0A5J6V7U2_9MICO|nr:DUF3073 domain-containing protein [Ornithinimicrobium pratense]QFG69627.1 DUF3073 domain-containing protein [Ornithinimicrobium pratense]